MNATVWDIVSSHGGSRAVGAPGRPWMSGAGLREHAATMRTALMQAGIGRGDRVAIVLPNGPEMATAFLSVAASCCAAPLNPAYKADEFEFYLQDLQPAAILLAAGEAGPAKAAADRLGIPVLILQPSEALAGGFTLDASALPTGPGSAEPPRPEDPALVLHTSGTTARPKIVPLTNANIADLRAPHRRRAAALGRPISASTSCRCSISTA